MTLRHFFPLQGFAGAVYCTAVFGSLRLVQYTD